MLAECATQLYIGRLMLLHIAYKAEKGMDLRQENSIAKVYLAHMVHHVIDTAIQLHGALGFSQDTPLAKWYTQVRSQRLVDGPDEVHRWKVGRNVIKAFREHGTTAVGGGRRFDLRSAPCFRPLAGAAPRAEAEASNEHARNPRDSADASIAHNDGECGACVSLPRLLPLHRLPADVAAAETFRPMDAVDRLDRRAAALR